jgi:DNA-binding NarL/FixJ family response regulator
MRIAVVSSSRWAAQGVAAALAREVADGDIDVQLHESIDDLARAGTQAPSALVIIATDGDAVRQVLERTPGGVPVLVLAEDLDDVVARIGAPRGALALLSLHADDAKLRAALAAVMQGLSVREDGLPRADHGAGARPAPPHAPLDPLTSRELEVFELLANGLTNRDIGEALHISAHTAKFHVAQILDKTGAATRAEAVRLGLRLGLIGI